MRIFHKPEREWLRLAAMVNPEWEAMQALTQEAPMWGAEPHFNWREVMDRANEHQLGAVARWRMLAPELDGECPEEAREEARAELERIDATKDDWLADARRVLTRLSAANVPVVVVSGFPAFSLYGMEWWPRELDDLDLAVPTSWHRGVREALAGLALEEGKPKESHLRNKTGAADFALPDFLEIVSLDAKRAFMSTCATFCDPMMYEGLQHIAAWGLSLPVPRPAAWLYQQACRLYLQMQWTGGPLHLGGLSRLHNIATVQRVDWEEVAGILHYFRGLTQWRLKAAEEFAELPLEEQPDLVRRTCGAAKVVWILRRVEEAYPGTVPTSFWDAVAPEVEPLAIAMAGFYNPGGGPRWSPGRAAPADDTTVYCEWAQTPTAEEFLFDWYPVNGLEARLEQGLWRVLEPEIRLPMDQQEWAAVHLHPLWQRNGRD